VKPQCINFLKEIIFPLRIVQFNIMNLAANIQKTHNFSIHSAFSMKGVESKVQRYGLLSKPAESILYSKSDRLDIH